MEQLNFDNFLDGEKELIYCPITPDNHWIRITRGHTPEGFEKLVRFVLHGMDYFYVDTAGKEKLLNAFDGSVKNITWEEATGYGKKSENEQSDEAAAAGNVLG